MSRDSTGITIDSEEFNDILYSMEPVRRGFYGVGSFFTSAVLGGIYFEVLSILSHFVFSTSRDGPLLGRLLIGGCWYGLPLAAICTFSGKLTIRKVILIFILPIIALALVRYVAGFESQETANPTSFLTDRNYIVELTISVIYGFLLFGPILLLPKAKPYIKFQLIILRFFAGQWTLGSYDEPSEF